MAETRKAVFVSVETKVKQDNSGDYYIVHLRELDVPGTNPVVRGAPLPNHLCFDKGILLKKAGEIVEFSSNEKNGTWFMNFPKERTVYGSGQGAARKDDTYAKINGAIQIHTMPMSYAKDIVIALINKSDLVPGTQNDEVAIEMLMKIYRTLHAEIIADKTLQGLLGMKDGGSPAKDADRVAGAQIRSQFANDVKAFVMSLTSLGWVIPADAAQKMLKRMSQGKDASGKPVGGKEKIDDMTDAEVQVAGDRFKMFHLKECPGEPKGCKYYKEAIADDAHAHYCSWTTRCFYIKNSSGRADA